jgi:hypothetical protein
LNWTFPIPKSFNTETKEFFQQKILKFIFIEEVLLFFTEDTKNLSFWWDSREECFVQRNRNLAHGMCSYFQTTGFHHVLVKTNNGSVARICGGRGPVTQQIKVFGLV